MKKTILFLSLIFFSTILVKAQCGGSVLTVNNPSFEGTPAAHVTPPGWDICMPGVTPDTQPGFWGQSLAPSNGSSYIGLVYAPSIAWQEGAGQTLSSPMVAGTNYDFSIDLAVPASADPATGIVVPPYCAQLQLWGGMSGVNSGCDQAELLWTSPVVSNSTWQTYNLNFTPTQNWNHILFLIYTVIPACSDGQYLMMDNMSPIVPQADVADFNATTVCVGASTQFSDLSTSVSGTITGWTWDFGDGSPTVNNQNPSHTFVTPGTYDVTLTIVSTIPCTTSVVNQVVVYAFPNVTATADPTSVCQGMPVTLTATGATDYSWSNGLGTSATVTAYPSTATTYTVTGSENGCSSTASVTVSAGQLQINASVISDVLCFGGNSGSAEVTISSGTAPYSYSWSPSGGSGSLASNLTSGTYTVTVIDSVGCQADTTLIISEPPLLIAQISDSTNVDCYGASTGNATVYATGGTPAYTYSWSPSGGTGATTTGIPAGNYMVVVTDQNSCSAATQVVITQSSEIQIVLNPDDENCPGTCNGFILSNITGGNPPYTYLWNTAPSQTSSTAQDLCTGTYDLTVTDSYNCIMTENASIGTSSFVSADFIATPPSGVIPLEVNFTYTGSGATEYFWDFGDGSNGNGSNVVHTYNNVGQYNVILYISSGPPDFCTDTMLFIIDAIQPSLLIVPNVFTPNIDGYNDEFKMEYEAIETFTCSIFNRWGKEIFSWVDISQGWNGETKGGNQVADGVYYFIIYAKGYDAVEYNLHGTVTILR